MECESDIATTDMVEYGSDFTVADRKWCAGKELIVRRNDKIHERIDVKARRKTVEAELE